MTDGLLDLARETLRTVKVLYRPDDVVEVRIFGTGSGTVSGYFDRGKALARAAANWDGKAPGVFVVMNPVNPALLARANNRLIPYANAG